MALSSILPLMILIYFFRRAALFFPALKHLILKTTSSACLFPPCSNHARPYHSYYTKYALPLFPSKSPNGRIDTRLIFRAQYISIYAPTTDQQLIFTTRSSLTTGALVVLLGSWSTAEIKIFIIYVRLVFNWEKEKDNNRSSDRDRQCRLSSMIRVHTLTDHVPFCKIFLSL